MGHSLYPEPRNKRRVPSFRPAPEGPEVRCSVPLVQFEPFCVAKVMSDPAQRIPNGMKEVFCMKKSGRELGMI